MLSPSPRPPASGRSLRRRSVAALAGAAFACLAGDALALQPLGDFLEHAKTWNPDNRAAAAVVNQRDAEVGISNGNLEPNLNFNFLYTHNQYEITTSSLFPSSLTTYLAELGANVKPMVPYPTGGSPEVIQPGNQFDGNIILQVPIINIANWERRAVSKATLEGAKADAANAGVLVQKNVTRDYYQLLGYEAVLLAATQNLDVAKHNTKLARDKKENGTGSELDVQRALADEAKASQQVTGAQLSVVNARRDLYSLSGVAPDPASTFPDDDLHQEPAIEGWLAGAATVPSVKSAEAARDSAEKATHAARTGWLPTVNGVAEEKFTNATAFSGGYSAFYLLQIAANWRLDNTILPQIHQQDAIFSAARANADKARINAEDAVYRDWQQVRADIDVSRAARAQVAATKLAASLAEDRYQNGVATQLDVLQARQDAFAAEVSRIQADSDLAYARTALRIDSGRYHAGDDGR
jgi:outer membrane protein TolC